MCGHSHACVAHSQTSTEAREGCQVSCSTTVCIGPCRQDLFTEPESTLGPASPRGPVSWTLNPLGYRCVQLLIYVLGIWTHVLMLFPTELAPQPLHLFLKQLPYVAQASFELSITQPLPPMCWRCSCNGKIDNSESLISWRPRPEADECLSIFWYMCSLWVPFLRIYNAFMLLSLSNLDFQYEKRI